MRFELKKEKYDNLFTYENLGKGILQIYTYLITTPSF
jgi:hypothetical protein